MRMVIVMDQTVLCYIIKNNKVLMVHRNKRASDLNTDKWMGVGGHIEEGERPDAALKREVLEETGLILIDYTKRGKVLFINDDYEELMYVYTANNFAGNIIECDEGDLHWVDVDDVLNLNIWEGDKEFLDILFNDVVYFEMELYYSKDKFIKGVRIR